MNDRGVVYVATRKDSYIEEAFLSAESIKRRYPQLPVTLFTDLSSHPLCNVGGCFDRVEPTTGASEFGSGWAAGQLDRLRCLARSPYKLTLHLDADTRVETSQLMDLFGMLDACDVAMVEAAADVSYSRRHLGRPMFHVGLILYRRNERIVRWLEEWIMRSEHNFGHADQTPLPAVAVLDHIADEEVRRNLLRMDQISLVEVLSPQANSFNLAVASLDYSWNFTGSRLPENNRHPPRILHLSQLRKATRRDTLGVAARWKQSGQDDAAECLYDYVAAKVANAATRPTSRRWPWRKPAAITPEEWASPVHRRASLHLRHGQPVEALEIFEQLLRTRPDDAYALGGQAEAAATAGRTAAAVDLIERALALRPRSPYLLTRYGEFLLIVGRPVDAITALRRALPDGSAATAFQLGQAWFALREYGKAAASYRTALRIEPRHAGAANNLLMALLGQHRYRIARDHADRILAGAGWDARALAFKAVALAELGASEDERRLVDLDRLIDIRSLPVPTGYHDIAEFNQKLSRALSATPTLEHAPPRHATRVGWHSGDLAGSVEPAVKALNAALMAAVEARMDEIDRRIAHPFNQHIPTRYRLHSWVVLMDRQGHQVPHIHGAAWMSGVYYVAVPDEIREDDPHHSGWLQFGRSEDRWHRPDTRTVSRVVFPKPGMLVTFPSFFWHGTVPTAGDQRRISFAFDIIPD